MSDAVGDTLKTFPHVYAIIFEVDAENRALEMAHKELMAYDRLKIGGRRPLESYEGLLDATESNSRGPYERRYQHFIDEDFREVYKHPVTNMDSCRKDWVFCLKFRNIGLGGNIRADGPHIILTSGASLNVRDIVIELENEDQVRIRVPGSPVKTETLMNMGFRNVRTKEARIFKELIEVGEYIQKAPGDRKIIGEINKKLQEYFATAGRFMSSGAPGSGRYRAVFKRMQPIQMNDFENTLRKAIKSDNEDLVHQTILDGLENGHISNEQAELEHQKYKGLHTQGVFDSSELGDDGSFHIE